MNQPSDQPDPAAVFGCALSLWHECTRLTRTVERLNLSECYNGGDEFMRVVMRVAHQFETWASLHIDFDELNYTWPYLMEEQFGVACVKVVGEENLAAFHEHDALRIALHLKLPVRIGGHLPIPLDVRVPNPIKNSAFSILLVRTMRDRLNDCEPVPFTVEDDPFDPDFGLPYFALFGISPGAEEEIIATRSAYSDLITLTAKIAPDHGFPVTPTSLLPPNAAR